MVICAHHAGLPGSAGVVNGTALLLESKFFIDNTVFIMNTLVLIIGVGPVGSTLALDLARRGVPVRLIDRASGPFPGSRAKGLQPRTLEIFADLGILDEVLAGAAPAYPKTGIHLGPLTVPWTMFAKKPRTDATPYPNPALSPQFNTDAVLHNALAAAGIAVEYNREVTGVQQDAQGVSTTLADGGTVRSSYVVGADGGSSTVRKSAGITFTGKTDEEDRMVIADVPIPGLRRDRWHIWPGGAGRFLAACPLPGSPLFQVMLRLPRAARIDNDPEALKAAVRGALARRRLTAGEFGWVSLFRPNVRLADSYRKGRIFLAGDAAHTHTPAGGQGLNTGVQDAYNLGWKLGQVVAGAPEQLLDTYESERRPIAAAVLKLSTERYENIDGNKRGALARGEEERQLSLNYRGGPLAFSGPSAPLGQLQAGDRLPDARDTAGNRVFDLLAGPGFGLLAIGTPAAAAALGFGATAGAGLRAIDLPAGTYGATEPMLVLVRPDGYLAAVAAADRPEPITRALAHFTAKPDIPTYPGWR